MNFNKLRSTFFKKDKAIKADVKKNLTVMNTTKLNNSKIENKSMDWTKMIEFNNFKEQYNFNYLLIYNFLYTK